MAANSSNLVDFSLSDKGYFYWLSVVMTYAGAVNNGFSGYFLSIPFIIVLISNLRLDGERRIHIPSILILSICTFLYFEKIDSTSNLFYPNIGRVIIPKNEFCIYDKEPTIEQKEFFKKKGSHLECPIHGEFRVDGVDTGNPDLGERYYPYMIDGNKKIGVTYFLGKVIWKDNRRVVVEEDFYRNIFVTPSLILFLPIYLFFIILGVLSKFLAYRPNEESNAKPDDWDGPSDINIH